MRKWYVPSRYYTINWFRSQSEVFIVGLGVFKLKQSVLFGPQKNKNVSGVQDPPPQVTAACYWSQLPDRGLWVRGACRRSARLNCATPRTTFLSFIHRKYPPLVLEGHVLSNTAWTPGGGRQKRWRRRRKNIRRREETEIRWLKQKCCYQITLKSLWSHFPTAVSESIHL